MNITIIIIPKVTASSVANITYDDYYYDDEEGYYCEDCDEYHYSEDECYESNEI